MRIYIIILALPKSVASRACACCESSAASRWARSWWARQTRTGVWASATRQILPLTKTQTCQVCVWTCVCVQLFSYYPPFLENVSFDRGLREDVESIMKAQTSTHVTHHWPPPQKQQAVEESVARNEKGTENCWRGEFSGEPTLLYVRKTMGGGALNPF